METTLGTIFLSELLGTATLILLGVGVVANTLLPKTKGHGTGWLLINWGWGLGVFAGVLVAFKSGAHLNPAVTIGILASGASEYVPGIPTNFAATAIYMVAQVLGAMIGAVLAWMTYKKHYDEDCDPSLKLGTFATAPEIRNPLWNTVSEIIGTFVLVFVVLSIAPAGEASGLAKVDLGWLGALGVGLLVLSIGASLGGPTGYAINPARDLGPRIVHQLLPIPGKRDSDWGYSWVPIVGPMIGGVIAGLVAPIVF
ncbi:glycerol uptake facilitator protein [Bowdeniella nasicola]|uniref:Glycerol uptake facilitator protein n=1 Tax=Bowdeniella nasicola TaxID=208480 RepID=A0A1H3VRR3_9ACTO|nr:MIP/aquaporin family protein [Bowdeniella nasicola]SDZ77503.1 glycerol uptake facilitator protein [Bowdeniella nasicola]